MNLHITLILFAAFLAFTPSPTVAQSSGHPNLSTQVFTPRSTGADYPLQKKNAIKEEDLQEKPRTTPSWVTSPEPGKFTVLPGIQEKTAPLEAVDHIDQSDQSSFIGSFKGILSDHRIHGDRGSRDAICVHGDGYGTVSSTIILYSEDKRQFYYYHAAGAPCRSDYVKVPSIEVL